jgi:multicomponent Na+:H+ antiporter subunit D
MSSFWIHPSLILIAGALLLPLVPARLKKAYLLLIPGLVFIRNPDAQRGRFRSCAVPGLGVGLWPG